MAGLILAINAGSSSLKCALHDELGERRVWSASVAGLAGEPRLSVRREDATESRHEPLSGGPMSASRALDLLLERLRAAKRLGEITAVGHRIVQDRKSVV